MNIALRAGLTADGDSQEPPNHLSIVGASGLTESVRFEALTVARRRELYELLRNEDARGLAAPGAIRTINEQISALSSELLGHLSSGAATNRRLAELRGEYQRDLGQLDLEIEQHYKHRIAELSAAEWKKIVGDSNAQIVQAVGALAAVAITVLTEGVAAPILATAVSYGSNVAARLMRDESPFQLDDVQQNIAKYKEFKTYQSNEAKAERQKRRDAIGAEKQAIKKAKLILEYANTDRESLRRAFEELVSNSKTLLDDAKLVTDVMARSVGLPPAAKLKAERVTTHLLEIDRLRLEAEMHATEVSRIAELTLWLEAVRDESADVASQRLARKFASDDLWRLDLVRSTRLRRAMNASNSYGLAVQAQPLADSWKPDELEYSKILEAMDSSVRSRALVEQANANTFQYSPAIQIPWRMSPRSTYEIIVGQDVKYKVATVQCVRVDGLGRAKATIFHGPDNWVRAVDGRFAHFSMARRGLGEFTSEQPEVCFPESTTKPSLVGSWSLELSGMNDGQACQQAPLVVKMRVTGR